MNTSVILLTLLWSIAIIGLKQIDYNAEQRLIWAKKETEENDEKKGIVLNRMYVGNYLSTNLGHEVINMFQEDDNNHYLYLSAK